MDAGRARLKSALNFGAMIASILLTYLLSIGPAVVIVDLLDHPTIVLLAQFIYAPIEWMHDHVPACQKVVRFYVELWK